MVFQEDIIHKIKSQKPSMRPAEKLVAQFVLKNPTRVTSLSTAAISEAAQVSEPTIIRFCKAMGLKGFPELKLKLAQSVATEEFAGRLELNSQDTSISYSMKVLESAQSGIGRFARKLDFKDIEKAVDLMSKSERLFFFGTGASGPVVMDAVYKFMKLKKSVVGYTDDWSQRMAANSFMPNDCIVCISYTGRTISIVNLARMAQEAGVKVIAVTKADSQLAQYADVTIAVEAPEDAQVYLPRHSRLVHFCVLEVLASGFTLSLGPDFQNRLNRVQQSLEDTRLPR